MLSEFAEAGWHSQGTSRSGGDLHELDVRDEDSVLRLRNRLDFVPDILVLNAGSGVAGPVEMISAEDAVLQIDTNLLGVDRMVRAFLPGMRERGSGMIVIVGSIASRVPVPFQALYCASKAGVALYAASLSMEVAPFGVRVLLVEPGDQNTSFGKARRSVQSPSDPYEPSTSRAIDAMIASEERGGRPDTFARKVVRVCGLRNSPFRITIASNSERAILLLAALLPHRLMQRAIRWAFNAR